MDYLKKLKQRKASAEKFFASADKYAPNEQWAREIIGKRKKSYQVVLDKIEIVEHNRTLMELMREGEITGNEYWKERRKYNSEV